MQLTLTCADCGELTPDAEGVLCHEQTCPHGDAMDRVRDADHEWFARHPNADHYWRAPAPAESDDYAMVQGLPVGTKFHGRVLVRRLSPTMNMRLYSHLGVEQ
ncbi:hypothetical protein GV794_23495 [Nocardia cyriacigeorgica]|uniref:Uncharacterized protein n=1 Tax=Nocardia cyriacigeorgica TaxID=135487 RepID=A0ABX0CQ09_9NOCA|nr:hypothetical protein [Nocardia cyriacigeorgica]NEW58585.1 hypothetical protein [Nocardia cyriacigeorgica]